jgi:hypothetical protein
VSFAPRALLAGSVLAVISAAACQRASPLQVRYLPGFVPATERVMRPTEIAVLPASGAMAASEVKVGAIYNPDGSVAKELAARDLGPTITNAVVRCLGDAGLKSFPLNHSYGAPRSAAFTLSTDIETISVDKRFTAEQTIHGQYFTMTAQVRLHFTLSSRTNPKVFSVVTTGTETEPPAPVGGEVFLPLETEPGESLSVALSRAVGALILQPEFRGALQGG